MNTNSSKKILPTTIVVAIIVLLAFAAICISVSATPESSNVPTNQPAVSYTSTGSGILMGDLIEVGISSYGELDVEGAYYGDVGYGFNYKPANAYCDNPWYFPAAVAPRAESLACWWDGEGYVIAYDSTVVRATPNSGRVGIVNISEMMVINTTDEAVYRVLTQTSDGNLNITFEVQIDKHDKYAVLTTTFKNVGAATINNLLYKRIADWDCNLGPGDDTNWDWISAYGLIKADDVNVSANKSFSYGDAALCDPDKALLYDHDLSAWDDITIIGHGTTYVPTGPVNGDYNGALYFNLSSLTPGESKSVKMVYAAGEGANSTESLADLLATIDRARSAKCVIPATVIIKPETLNLASNGVFTAFITLPEPYDIANINISTVVCEDAPAVKGIVADDNKYIAKFNVQDLVGVDLGDAVTLTVTGKLYDGTPFEGSDTIRVIDKGGKK